MMKFRQRVAWLMVAGYLAGTFAFFYYVFEINEHYNQFALDHVKRFHKPAVKTDTQTEGHEEKTSLLSSIWSHVTDLPLPVWLLIFLLPYLQIFMMILACTRAEPRLSAAYIWPGLVYLKYQQLFGKNKSQMEIGDKARMTSNGLTVIHT